jgi:hypothetical protein
LNASIVGRVVTAPVEAAVHGLLDAAAGRLEHPGYRQCRNRHRQARPSAEQLTKAQDHQGVATTQQQGEQAVGEDAADDAVRS